MKKTVTAVLCLVIVLLFAGCGKADISKVKNRKSHRFSLAKSPSANGN